MDRQISKEFRQTAQYIKHNYPRRTYKGYEARVRRAVRQHPPSCMCPFHGGHR